MNAKCPECGKVYRIDPARVPEQGARTRCTACGTVFRVDRTGAAQRAEAQPAASNTATPRRQPAGGAGGGASASSSAGRPAFGPQDPDERARRLARALVSDIVAYHGERREQSLKANTLRKEFREEILKSWEEYVEQVGREKAQATPYFRDALNEILAGGQKVF